MCATEFTVAVHDYYQGTLRYTLFADTEEQAVEEAEIAAAEFGARCVMDVAVECIVTYPLTA